LQKLRETADTVLTSKLWATLRETIERDPAPCLLALGLAVDKPKKPLKTMAAIFTGKGKGGNKENGNTSNPIGFAVPQKKQTLCSVGFGQKQLTQTMQAKQEGDASETVRVREDQIDANTGEYFVPTFVRTGKQRSAADSWVQSALRK
jgi:hypothetical protein